MAIDFATLDELADAAIAAYGGEDLSTGGWIALLPYDPVSSSGNFNYQIPADLSSVLSFDSEGFLNYRSFVNAIDLQVIPFFKIINGEKVVVIAFRGTQEALDFLTDFDIAIPSILYPALEVITPFFEAVRDYAQSIDASLYTAGHSLGGALAELLFAQNQADFAGGLGMGSPGYGPTDGGFANSTNFVHIAHQNDLISGLLDGSHVAPTIIIDNRNFGTPAFGWGPHGSATYQADISNISASPAFQSFNIDAIADGSRIYIANSGYPFTMSIASAQFIYPFAAPYVGFIGSPHGDSIDGSGATTDLRIDGSGGVDTIQGGGGNDTIYGGNDFSVIYGGGGADLLIGASYADDIRGQDGNDTIEAGGGENELYGGIGNDSITAGSGWDSIRGEADNDTLIGGGGSDTIYGDEGSDQIAGGTGGDILRGGSGADTFVYQLAELGLGSDIIEDFNQGNSGSFDALEGDTLDLRSLITPAGIVQPEGNLVRFVARTDGSGLDLLVDPDGTGGDYHEISVAFLKGLSSGAGLNVLTGAGGTAPTAIAAVSAPGSYTISPSSRVVNEGTGTITFTITRPHTANAETVYVSTTINRGSLNDEDYDGWLNEPVTFAAGDATETVTITINDDGEDETAEQFGLIIQSSPSQPASQFLASASFTIIDDDLAGASNSFSEGGDTVWIDGSTTTNTTLDGLGGNDTAIIDVRSVGTMNTSYNIATGAYSVVTTGGILWLYNVENFAVIAGSGDDSLYGGPGTDLLFGGSGEDQLIGGAGIDVLDGGSGNDRIVEVGYGDIVEGGNGIDRLYFDVSTATEDITINLATGQGAGGPWTGIEVISGVLGSGNDTVVGGFLVEYLNGGGGNNLLSADYSGAFADGRTVQRLDLSIRNSEPHLFLRLSDESVIDLDLANFQNLSITGSAGNDSLNSSAGNDTLLGAGGDDNFDPGTGVDLIDGGAGNDTATVIRSNLTQAVVYDSALAASAGGITLPDGTLIRNVEHVHLTTGSGNDIIAISGEGVAGVGQGGYTLDTGAGDDTASYVMSSGHFYFYAGDGNDRVRLDFSDVAQSVGLGFAQGEVQAGWDWKFQGYYYAYSHHVSLYNVEHYEVIGGSAGDNLWGEGGHDRFEGRGGNDVLYGGAGNDTLLGGDDNDSLDPGTGVDLIDGGAGNDTATVDRSALTQAVVYDSALAASAGGITLPDGTLIRNVEHVHLTTGSGNDTIAISNSVTPNTNDVYGLYTGAGDDRVSYVMSEGRFQLDAGDGNDRVQLDFAGVSASIYLGRSHGEMVAGWNWVWPSYSQGVSLYNVEHYEVIGGSAGDNLWGEGGHDRFEGRGGNDALYGGAGNDTLLGGEGDDSLDAGSGSDSIDGGAGNDTAYFTGYRADYLITYLGNGAYRIADTRVGAPDGEDTVSGVEVLQFADMVLVSPFLPAFNLAGGAGADSLVGAGGDDTISGAGGDDTLLGEDGADSLSGGSGNDIVEGGGGNDTIDGAAGNDSLDGGAGDDRFLVGAGSGTDTIAGGPGQDRIVATAANIAISVSQLSGIEEVDGAGHASVRIAGTAAAETLDFSATRLIGIAAIDGGNGADSIIGSAGNDTIIGSFGNDSLDGGDGDDRFLIGTASGTDTFLGGAGHDRIMATAANAVIGIGLASGIEAIDGGGFANVRIGGTPSSDLMDLSATALAGIAAIDGGNGNDTITGPAAAVSINGGNGHDSLLGGGGNDTLDGGIGNDRIDGGSGANSLIGGEGNDAYIVRSTGDRVVEATDGGIDSIETDLAVYSLATLTQVENLAYTGAGNATLSGNSLSNRLTGGGGSDSLGGGSGNDTLAGGDGNDTLNGSFGNDSLDGGSGDDTFLIGAASGIDSFSGGTGHDRILVTAANAVIGVAQLAGIESIDGGGLANVRIVATAASELLDFSGVALSGIAAIDGGNGKDTIVGSTGADTIVGGYGNDSMDGGEGDDTFLIGTASGTDTFIGGAGHDRIVATAANATIALGLMSGVEAIDGGGLANVRVLATAASELLDFSGMALTGIAAIHGGNGKDTIVGSAGDDTIIGGNGQDVMTGGGGADSFVFTTTAESSRSTPDTIADFVLGMDRIDLSAIDGDGTSGTADAFAWIGAGAFTGTAGELRYALSGGNTVIQGDTNGDGVADIQIVLAGTFSLDAGAFAL